MFPKDTLPRVNVVTQSQELALEPESDTESQPKVFFGLLTHLVSMFRWWRQFAKCIVFATVWSTITHQRADSKTFGMLPYNVFQWMRLSHREWHSVHRPPEGCRYCMRTQQTCLKSSINSFRDSMRSSANANSDLRRASDRRNVQLSPESLATSRCMSLRLLILWIVSSRLLSRTAPSSFALRTYNRYG